MKKIIIEFIRNEDQRYPTVGDYYYDDNGDLLIKVSDLGDEYMNRCIAIHELIEEGLTKKRGIPEEQIMAFDKMFEQEREEGRHSDTAEPGNDPRSPYGPEHFFSESVERLYALELEVDWRDYEQRIYSL